MNSRPSSVTASFARLTDKRITEILERAELCDESVVTDYRDMAAAMHELQSSRKEISDLRQAIAALRGEFDDPGSKQGSSVVTVQPMNKHLSTASPDTAVLTLTITDGWQEDNSKRKTDIQCFGVVTASSNNIPGITVGETKIRLGARSTDFNSEPPDIHAGNVVEIAVKNVAAHPAKGKGANCYYSLVPNFGLVARSQPAILLPKKAGCCLKPQHAKAKQ